MSKALTVAVFLSVVSMVCFSGCGPCNIFAAPEVKATPAEPAAPPPAEPKPCDMGGTVSASQFLPTGEKACSVVVVEKTGPRNVVVGQEFSYDLKVTNLTKLTLADVEVTETLAQGFKVKFAKPKATLTGQDLKWKIDRLAPEASETMTVTGTVEKSGAFTGCTAVTYRPPAVCLDMNAVELGLKAVKSGPADGLACDPVVYKVVVTNTGTATLCNVVVKDELPAGLTTLDGQKVVMSKVGDLKPGESREMTIQAKADKPGSYTNKATAMADGNVTVASNEVTTVLKSPTLAVTKTGPAVRYVGLPVEYTIAVTNTGDAPAKDTVLEDRLDPATKFVSATDGGVAGAGKVTWNLGTLAPGAKKEVRVTVSAGGPGKINDTASAVAYCAPAASASAATDVKGVPAILLEMVDVDDPDLVGTEETYIITVTNQGSAPGTNIVIKATLPAEQSFVSADGQVKGANEGQVVTFAPLPSLAAKAKATYTVKVKNNKAGDVRFRVQLTSDQMTSPVEESESTHIYE
jgi:uncharacterized repeat protein (TIGR01451 family)